MQKDNQQILDGLELKRKVLKYTITFLAMAVFAIFVCLLNSSNGPLNKFRYGILIDSYPNRGKYGPDYVCRVKLPNKQIIFASCGPSYTKMSNVTVVEVKTLFGNSIYSVVPDSK